MKSSNRRWLTRIHLWLGDQAELKRTPLFDFHKQNGAKMVPFAGWEMPLSYGSVGQSQLAIPMLRDNGLNELIRILNTVATAHGHVRTQAGLFDVSHMLQHVFTGKSSLEFLSSLCPSSLTPLAPWSSTLSVLLNEEGGIIDDMIVTKHGEDGQGGQRFYVVTNAGRAEEDVAWITKKLEEWNSSEGKGKGKEVKWEKLEGYGLVALQGTIKLRPDLSCVAEKILFPSSRAQGCRDSSGAH